MAAKLGTTRGLLATDHVILNHGQVTWTTPELAPPLLTTTPHQWEDVSALDRFNVHRCPTRRVFSGTGLEPVTKQATVRYLYHSATAATKGKGQKFDILAIQLEFTVHECEKESAFCVVDHNDEKYAVCNTDAAKMFKSERGRYCERKLYGQVTKTTPELAPSSPNFNTIPMGGRLYPDIFNGISPLCKAGLQGYKAGTHDTPATSSLP
ncbi:uncharacterized protein TNCV_1027701 [Trichonephila clavipes]|nr:uncharacterized protein TNCV_1027701 [Trichonephila clavipes]